MQVIICFITGTLIGLSFWLISRRIWQKERKKLHSQNNQLAQEKRIAVDFMHNLAEAIGEGVDKSVLYQRILHTAVISTGAMSACIYEKLPNGRLKGIVTEGLFPPQRSLKAFAEEKHEPRARFIEKILNSEILESDEGIIGQVARTGKPVFVPDAMSDPRIIKHDDASLEVYSMIFSPLVHNEKTIGVLAVANPSNNLPFSETDFSMVNSLGEQAALAIKNSDAMNLRFEKTRMDSDLRLAHDVQELFLTKVFPPSKDLEIDARYVPSSQVGGDFYDFYKLSPSKYCLSVADVSGKGVPASLLMALCQTHLKHLVQKSRSPAEVLKLLNEELFPRIRKDMFITLFLVMLDIKNGKMIFARAGHEPAILVKSPDEIDLLPEIIELKGNGMALGMVEPDLFSQLISNEEADFSKGDILCLYTDGLTESANQDMEEYGLDRLKEHLRNSRGLDTQSVNDTILKDLNKYCQQNRDRDDLTLLTVKHI